MTPLLPPEQAVPTSNAWAHGLSQRWGVSLDVSFRPRLLPIDTIPAKTPKTRLNKVMVSDHQGRDKVRGLYLFADDGRLGSYPIHAWNGCVFPLIMELTCCA